MAEKALKDIQRGDKVVLTDPDGFGEVTKIENPAWGGSIKVHRSKAIEIIWRRSDGGGNGHYMGHPEDVIRVAD